MLQYLRAERIVPAYQTRGYKLVELVRIYEGGYSPAFLMARSVHADIEAVRFQPPHVPWCAAR